MPNKILKKKPKNKKPKKKPVKKSAKYILRNPKVNMTPQVIYRQGLTQTLQPESTKTYNEVVKLKNENEINNQLLSRKFDNETTTLNNRMEDQNKNLLNRLDDQTKYFNDMGSQLVQRLINKPHQQVIESEPEKTRKSRSDVGKARIKKVDFNNIKSSAKPDIVHPDVQDYNKIYSDMATDYPDSFNQYFNDMETNPEEFQYFDIGDPDEDKNQKVTLQPVQTRSKALQNNNPVPELKPISQIEGQRKTRSDKGKPRVKT